MTRSTALLLLAAVACGNTEQHATAPTPSASAATPSATVSATPTATASATASATAEPPQFTKPLKEIVAGAKTIVLVWREKMDSKEGFTVNIKTDAGIKGIVTALGGDQIPQGHGQGMMTTFSFTFQDAAGTRLASVSLYSSATMRDSSKKYGAIDLPNGTSSGIIVSDYADLQKKLKALNVDLP
jgi:hypothetical protein